MRTAWKEAGIFDRDTKTYYVEKIPRPPEARAIVEREHDYRETHVGYELKAGCPKCLDQIVFRWGRHYGDSVIEDAYDVRNPELLAVRVAREMHDKVTRAETEAQRARTCEFIATGEAERLRTKIARILRAKAKKDRKRRRRGRPQR